MEENVRGEMKIVEEPKKPLAMHPKKFALWLFMASVMMLFASWTSAYIVRQAEGNWLYFELPILFGFTSAIIVISSGTMQWAYFAARRDRIDQVSNLLWSTLALGLVFLVGQVLAWGEMVRSSVYFVGNPAGSFVYVITGFHGLHIISAIIFLLIVIRSARLNRIGSGNMAQIEMCATYWHFLGGLWVYLYLFLSIYR